MTNYKYLTVNDPWAGRYYGYKVKAEDASWVMSHIRDSHEILVSAHDERPANSIVKNFLDWYTERMNCDFWRSASFYTDNTYEALSGYRESARIDGEHWVRIGHIWYLAHDNNRATRHGKRFFKMLVEAGILVD